MAVPYVGSIGDLAAAARILLDAAASSQRKFEAGTDLADALDVARLLTRLLNSTPGPSADRGLILLATSDATRLATVIGGAEADASGHAIEVVLARRFMESGGNVVEALERGLSDAESVRQRAALQAVADAYGLDATSERAAARRVRTWGAAAVGAGLIAAGFAGAGIPTDGSWLVAASRLLAVGGLFLVAALLFRSGAAHERAAREYIRLERGLTAIEPYLAPLPEAARHFLRATMTQSLFPQLLEDDDPLRQQQWPTSRDLLWASYSIEPPPDGANEASEGVLTDAGDGTGIPERGNG